MEKLYNVTGVMLQSVYCNVRPTHFVRSCIAWCDEDAAPFSLDTELRLAIVLERALAFKTAYGHYLSTLKARI